MTTTRRNQGPDRRLDGHPARGAEVLREGGASNTIARPDWRAMRAGETLLLEDGPTRARRLNRDGARGEERHEEI